MANEVEILVTGRDRTDEAYRAAGRRARPAGERVGEQFSEGVGEGTRDNADAVGDGLADVFGKIGPLVAAAAATVGLAAGAAIVGAIGDAMNREKLNDRLAAQLGSNNPEWSAQLGRVAGKVYADAYGESLGEVNEAIRGVIQQGLVMEDASAEQIEGITKKVLDLASAFELDLGQATRAVGKMLDAGLAKDADEALDILTRGFQQGADEAGDLLDTMSEYSTKFRDIGLSGQQAMGLITQGLQAGARDADVVADALKEFSIRAIDGSVATARGMRAIGLDAAKMAQTFAKGGPEATAALDMVLDKLRAIEDPVKRDAAAVDLFGTKAEDMGDALFALDLDTAVAALGKVDGAAQRMGDTLGDNAATKIEAFKRKALGAFSDFAARGITLFEKFVNSPRVKEFAQFIQENILPALQRLGAWIGEKIIPVVAKLVDEWIAKGVEAFKDLQGVMKDNEAEIEQLMGWLQKAAEFIMQKVIPVVGPFLTNGLRSTIKIISVMIDWIGFLIRTWNGAVDFFKKLPGRISAATSSMWDGIKNAFRSAMNWVIDRWNSLEFRLPSFTAFGMTIGGATIGVPDIPRMAHGGIGGGWRQLHERGGELVKLPQGSMVYPHGQSQAMLDRAAGRNVTQVVVTLDPSLTGPTRDLVAAVVKGLRFAARPYGGSVDSLVRAGG